jgi:hypothetical protein
MRWIGVGLVSAGLATWMIVDIRPVLLVAPDGRLMVFRTDKGRVVDHPRAESYVASQWLIKDGDLANQEQAAERIGLDRGYSGGKAQLENGWLVMNVIKRNPDIARLSDLCKEKTVLIVPHIRNEIDGPCIFLFGDGLKAAGALAFKPEGEGVKITTAAQMAGRRFWTGYQPGGARSRP